MDTNTDTNMNLHIAIAKAIQGRSFILLHILIPKEYQKLCLNVKTFYGLLPIPNVVPIVGLVRVR